LCTKEIHKLGPKDLEIYALEKTRDCDSTADKIIDFRQNYHCDFHLRRRRGGTVCGDHWPPGLLPEGLEQGGQGHLQGGESHSKSTYFYYRWKSWNRVSVHAHSAGADTATFTGDGKCNERGVGVHPPPSSAWANFTLMMVCTPESSHCYFVYSVVTLFSPTVFFIFFSDICGFLTHWKWNLSPLILSAVAQCWGVQCRDSNLGQTLQQAGRRASNLSTPQIAYFLVFS
jgi:hypothetical protein